MPAKPLTKSQQEDAARLRAIFEERQRDNPSLTQENLAYECGWKTQGTVNQYLHGKIPLNVAALTKFSLALRVKPEQISPALAKTMAAMAAIASANGGEVAPSSSLVLAEFPIRKGDEVEIPQFNAGGSMGNGRLTLDDQPGVIKSWRVSPEWITRNIGANTGFQNLCIVTGFGPSMRPLYNPGDPLLVDLGVNTLEAEGVYFFRVGEHGFIKQLQRIPTSHGLIIRAKSYNPTYDPFDISEDMDFQIFGKILTVWKSEIVF